METWHEYTKNKCPRGSRRKEQHHYCCRYRNVNTTNVQQGLAKVWALYRQSDNSTYDDFNISSTDDDTTGQVGFNFTNNMAGQTYSTQKLCQVSDAGGFNDTGNNSIETTQVTIQNP